MSAVISSCGQYRYLLSRPSEAGFLPERGTALWIMLNPSTADADIDDPTIRRCRSFSRLWGCAGLTVANLYALRSTDPAALRHHIDPVGADNDATLQRVAAEYGDAICAWGANADPGRANAVTRMLREAGARLWCLGTTKAGAPRHPLYVAGTQELLLFKEPASRHD